MSKEIHATSVSSFRELTSEEFDMIAGGKMSLRGYAGAVAGGAIGGAIAGAILTGGAGAANGAIAGAVTAGVAYYVSGMLEQ